MILIAKSKNLYLIRMFSAKQTHFVNLFGYLILYFPMLPLQAYAMMSSLSIIDKYRLDKGIKPIKEN